MNVSSVEIRQKRDLERHYNGLIIPRGESTVQDKLMREMGLFEPIKERAVEGLPVLSTCDGLLLLAKRIKNDERRQFATMNITVVRKAYPSNFTQYKPSL